MCDRGPRQITNGPPARVACGAPRPNRPTDMQPWITCWPEEPLRVTWTCSAGRFGGPERYRKRASGSIIASWMDLDQR